MPHTPVSQLRNGLTLQKDVYLLREKSVRAMRSGGLMLSATLADKGGSVAGVMFDISGPLADSLRTGAGVEVSGQVGEYRGQLQVKLDRIRAVEIVDYEAYLPMARRSLDEMEAELQALIASIERPDLARLLSAVFDDGDIARRFTRAPAAKLNHHACIGGLLEHSLSVARLVGTATDLYPEMDGDLAISVALLHDIGKMGSYEATSFEITEEGALWGHVYAGSELVQRKIDGLAGFDPELRRRIVHAILAHHGRLEAGSPVVPMTLEAMVVHHADHLDGDVRGAIDHMERDGGSGVFTERSFMHDTRLYRGGETPSGPPKQGALL